MSNIIIDVGNSDLVNSLANISQFINIWQSTKSATYSQLATEIINQNKELENKIFRLGFEITNYKKLI